jgi:uncharacterized protein (TIGR02594 family)
MTTNVPKQYLWLAKETAPKMLIEALKLFGTQERPGNTDNPEILGWADEIQAVGYKADEIPWCGLFMGVVAKRAGKSVPENPLWAKNWAAWGDAVQPQLGCVMVFTRAGGGGHVGLYIGEDKESYHVLGGNQGDSVSIMRIRKERAIASRASYKIPPSNARPIILSAVGDMSTNEA